MSMDTHGMYESLRQLQTWRNQIMGLGLLPPDLTALIKFIEEAPGEVERVKEEKAQLQKELAQLKTEIAQLEPDLQRAAAARCEADAEEARLRALKRDFAEFKVQIGVGA